MKKFVLVLCCLLAAFLIILCVLIFVPLPGQFGPLSTPPRYEKGPKVYYHVLEGAVDVFSYRNGKVGSLLSVVRPGETFTARPVSEAALKIPIWMEWMEPVTVAAVERANLFMYKESKKALYSEFAVGYTDETIQRGFTKEIEKAKLLSNIRINFHSDGFTVFAQVQFIPISVRGYVSTQGTSDHLYLRLRWVKVGGTFLPEHILRALENIFSQAYVASGHPSIKLLRVDFSEKTMVMYYRKEGVASSFSKKRNSLSEPEIIFPSGK